MHSFPKSIHLLRNTISHTLRSIQTYMQHSNIMNRIIDLRHQTHSHTHTPNTCRRTHKAPIRSTVSLWARTGGALTLGPFLLSKSLLACAPLIWLRLIVVSVRYAALLLCVPSVTVIYCDRSADRCAALVQESV